MLTIVAWLLLDGTSDDARAEKTGNKSTGQLCKLVIELSKAVKSEDLARRTVQAAEKFKRQSGARNHIVHATPYRGDVIHVREIFEAIAKRVSPQGIESEEPKSLAAQLQATAVVLQRIANDIDAERRSS